MGSANLKLCLHFLKASEKYLVAFVVNTKKTLSPPFKNSHEVSKEYSGVSAQYGKLEKSF